MIRQPGANVANPRPFIKTKTYFGPDRRRNTTSNYIGPKVAGMSRSKDKASVVDHGDRQVIVPQVARGRLKERYGHRVAPDCISVVWGH